MKKIEIEARIRAEALKEIPDIYEKIDLNRIVIEPKTKRVWNFNFAKSLKLALTSIFVLVSGFFVFNYFFSPDSSTNTPLASETELLGFQTVSAAVLLEQVDVVEMSYSSSYDSEILYFGANENLNIDDYLNDINPFINLMETILNTDSNIQYTSFVSDLAEYEFAFTYSSKDLAKEAISYKIYYNKDPFSGIIIHKNLTYAFTHDNLQTTVYLNNENYISVTNNSDETQQKFAYQFYFNNQLQQENEIEVYRVQRTIQVRATINKSGATMRLYFQRKFYSNLDEIEIDYEIEDNNQSINGKFQVNLEFDQQMNMYRYRYVISKDEILNRPRGPFSNPASNFPPRFNTIL